MFIAHIPVGLMLARCVTRKPLTMPIILAAGLGAMAPDFDLIRFYLFDNHLRHHHDYWTHIPAVWGLIVLAWFGISKGLKRGFGILPAVFFIAVFSHLLLDTVAGEIEWLWPFMDRGFHLVTVPASHGRWYLSFVTHWTFGIEIGLSIFAAHVAFGQRSKSA